MTRYLTDTNILLRLANQDDAEHALVKQAVAVLFSNGDSVAIVAQNVYEFWAVATRPKNVNGFGWSPQETRRQIDLLVKFFALLPDTPSLFSYWLELVTKHGVSGKKVHDTRPVAAMQAHAITHLLTLNTDDFKRFDIMAVHPARLNS